MILLTPELRERLLDNGRCGGTDHVPVVKFFNPLGVGTWLATELDEDGDTLFGLADLGEPELGSFSLSAMETLRLPFGMGIERDILFEGAFPLSVYAMAARQAASSSANARAPRGRASLKTIASISGAMSGDVLPNRKYARPGRAFPVPRLCRPVPGQRKRAAPVFMTG